MSKSLADLFALEGTRKKYIKKPGNSRSGSEPDAQNAPPDKTKDYPAAESMSSVLPPDDGMSKP